MFRHVVLFRWKAATSDADVEEIARRLRALPAAIAELRDYRVGADAGYSPGTWDFVVVADFDDADGWRAYRDHPDHLAVRTERIEPAVAERASVQYEC